MKTFQSTHLSTGDVAKIKNLSDSVFDDTVLYRLLALLSTSFEPYNPDNTVMTYLKQRESTEKPEPINMGPDFFLDARGQDGSDNESASADTESQLSPSEGEDSNEEQDHSENSGDDSSPPPSPSDDEHEEWE